MTTFKTGDKVRALVEMINDLREDGLGLDYCAAKGDLLVVRSVGSGYLNCIGVSHENVTDRAFCVSPTEIELITTKETAP